jgi:ATP-binding cassette subfamily B protein
MNRELRHRNLSSPEEGKTQNSYKKYEGPNVYLRLGKYLFVHKRIAVICLILVVISNLLALIGPNLSGKAIDAIQYDFETATAHVDFPTVFRYCGYMALFYVGSAALSYVLSIVMTIYSQRITRTLRKEVFDRLISLPVG